MDITETCDVCGKSFSNRQKCRQHKNKVHADPVPCPQCDKPIKPAYLATHLLTHQPGGGKVGCDQCGAMLAPAAIRRHVQNVHTKKSVAKKIKDPEPEPVRLAKDKSPEPVVEPQAEEKAPEPEASSRTEEPEPQAEEDAPVPETAKPAEATQPRQERIVFIRKRRRPLVLSGSLPALLIPAPPISSSSVAPSASTASPAAALPPKEVEELVNNLRRSLTIKGKDMPILGESDDDQ